MLKKAIITWVISGVLLNILGVGACGWLFKCIYFIEPTAGLRAEMLSSQKTWFLLMGAVNFILAALLVIGYVLAYNRLPHKGIKKGIIYGFFIWFTGGLFYLSHAVMTFRMSAALFFFWLALGLLSCVLVGVVVSVVYKEL